MLTVLTSDYDYFEEHAEKICSKILPQKINNDRDLYRVYAKSAKDVPTVLLHKIPMQCKANRS